MVPMAVTRVYASMATRSRPPGVSRPLGHETGPGAHPDDLSYLHAVATVTKRRDNAAVLEGKAHLL